MVSTYLIFWLDEEGNGHDDYFQAGNAQQAADWAREYLGAYEVAEIAKVVKNWK